MKFTDSFVTLSLDTGRTDNSPRSVVGNFYLEAPSTSVSLIRASLDELPWESLASRLFSRMLSRRNPQIAPRVARSFTELFNE